MERKHKRGNLEMLFEVKQIPCGEQIRNIVNNIAPSELKGVFKKAHAIADKQGILDSYRVP
jgi:hypothetical protein